MDYVLAQVNVGRLVAPLDSPLIADFVAALDPVNAMADASPGFVWRLQTEDGNATAIRAFERDAEGAGGGILIAPGDRVDPAAYDRTMLAALQLPAATPGQRAARDRAIAGARRKGQCQQRGGRHGSEGKSAL